MVPRDAHSNSGHNKILSITVPAYKVEDYLKQCLDSFLAEDILDDLEILIIDDGSPDHSKVIAETYQTKFPHTFRLISKENGGHGSAVNRGIREASGKYFKVVDGDDWVDSRALANLVHWLKQTDSDLVVSNYLWVYEKTGQKRPEMKEPFAGVQYYSEYRFDEICSKLYIKMHAITIKTSILKQNHICLDEGCYYVDTEYITYPIPYIQTIFFIPDCVYMYRIGLNGQSVNIKSMQKNINDHLRVVRSLIEFYLNIYTETASVDNQRRFYIEGMINRVIASQFKIYLSFGPSRMWKQELIKFDQEIRRKSAVLYKQQRHKVVRILRSTNFLFYWPAAWFAKWILTERAN